MVNLLLKIVLIVSSIIVGIGSVYVFKQKPDNIVEEISEQVIKDQTGLDVDLSPSSPENKTPADNTKPAGDVTDHQE